MTSLLRSIASIFSGRVATVSIGAAFTPLLVRIVSQSQFGLYASVLAAFTVITLLVKGGLFDATRKIVAERTGDPADASSVVATSFVLGAVYGLGGTVLVVAVAVSGAVPATYVPYLWILAGTLSFVNLFTAVRGTFYGLQTESVGELLKVARRLLYATLALVLAYVGYDVLGVFVGYALSFVAMSVLGVALLHRRQSLSMPTRDDVAANGREMAAYGGFQLVGGLSAILLYKADILLVDFFRGQSATGLYQSAIVPAEMIWFVPSVIQLAFLQHTASLWADDDVEAIEESLRLGVKYAVLSLTLFGVGLFALAEPFLVVYFGTEYVEASTTLRVLVAGTFFFGTTRAVVPVLQATGWVRYTELVTGATLLVNVGLNVALIPRYGIVGAGVGTATSYVLYFLAVVLLWHRSPLAMVSPWWAAKLVLTQASFAAGFLLLVSLVDVRPLVSLLVFPVTGLLLFLGINGALGYVPRSTVAQLVGR